jgi:MFS family permease
MNSPENCSHESHPSPYRWLILALLMALCFSNHFNRASMASAGDERLIKQFNISPESMGWVYSAFLIFYTIFMIPGGLFIDRFGPRAALMLMGFGTAFFCTITGAVGWGLVGGGQVWVTLLLVRSLMGLFTTPLHPGCARAASNWFPVNQRVLANGLITGAALLAYALVHPVFGRLIDLVDWQKAFLMTGACTALLTLVWALVATDSPQNKKANEAQQPLEASQSAPDIQSAKVSEPGVVNRDGLAGLFLNRNIFLLTLSYAAVGYFQYLFFYWMHYYFDEILHLGKTESRFYAGLPNLAMATAMPFGGWLTDVVQRTLGYNRGRRLVPRTSMLASAALLLLGIFCKDTFWIVFWFTLSLGILGLCEGAFWATAVEIGGKRGGTAAAIMNTGGNGIGLLAPIVTPWLSAKAGWTWGISLGAFISMLGALCWWWIVPKEDMARSLNDKMPSP